MIYTEKPADFNPKMRVVGCLMEHEGKIALLHRHDHKPQGDTWCLPGGKVEGEESAIDTIVRELYEETGYRGSPSEFTHVRTYYVKYPEYDFVYDVFHLGLREPHEIVLEESAHKEGKFVEPQEALAMNLILDEDASIKLYYGL